MKILFGIERESNKEIHIVDATKKRKYVCVLCGQPLIVNEGPVMGKFFRHYRPDEDCELLSRDSSSFDNSPYKEPNDGIHQSFSEWMAYLRAIREGDQEKAATLWDFDLPKMIKETNVQEIIPDLVDEPVIEKESSPIEFELSKVENPKEFKSIPPIDDDIEWYSNQAMLKPIISGGFVKNCPLGEDLVTDDKCENCTYCTEFRQPILDPDKPNVVVCRGHHELEREITLF